MQHLPRFSIIIMALIAATLACSLGPTTSSNQQSALTQPTAYVPPSATSTPTIESEASDLADNQNTTNTSNSTSSGQTSGSSGSSGSGYVACNPRTDWYVYRVVSGDTLGAIARRVNSTVGVLAAANCLANANTIHVGQALYVPQLPIATNTPIPPPPNPQRAGYVSISPALFGSTGSYYLQANTMVTLTYSELPVGTVRVDFYVTLYNQNASAIGADSNFADGVNISWLTPPNTGGTIEAVALHANGSIIQRSFGTDIATTVPLPAGTCILQAVTENAVNVYHQPVATSKWGDLLPGQWMVVDGRTNDGWIAVHPSLVASLTIFEMKWVAPSNLVLLQGPCNNLRTIPIVLPSTGCFITGSPDIAIPYYERPYDNSVPLGSISAGTNYEVMGQTTTGWYAIDTSSPDIAPSGYGVYGMRWIKSPVNLPPGPQCATLPTVY